MNTKHISTLVDLSKLDPEPISSGYLTLDHMGTPLKIKILKSSFLHARDDQKNAQNQNFMHLGPQMAKIRVDNRKRVNFLHWTIWGPPLKIKILKSGFLHAREDQKIGPEPKFHVPRSSNGKDWGGNPNL